MVGRWVSATVLFIAHIFPLFPCQPGLVHPTSTPVPAGAAFPSPGPATWTMTVEIAQMNRTPAVTLHFHAAFRANVSVNNDSSSALLSSFAAYPTCFPLTQFTCANGRCININWRCDNGELRSPRRQSLSVELQLTLCVCVFVLINRQRLWRQQWWSRLQSLLLQCPVQM